MIRPDAFMREGKWIEVGVNPFSFLQKLGIVPVFFGLSVVCTVCSLFFNLLGLRLFIPLLQGLVSGDFTSAGDKFGLTRAIASHFPSAFGSPRSMFYLLLGMIFVSVAMKNAFDYVSALCIGREIRKAESGMRQLLFSRYLEFGKLFFDRTNIANVSHVMTSTSGLIASQMQEIKSMLTQILSLVVYLGVMFWISWELALVALLVFPTHHLVTMGLVNWIKDASREHEHSRINLAERIFNVFSCIPLVKSYQAEELERRRLAELSDNEIDISYRMHRKQLLIRPVQDLNTMVSLLLIVLVMAWMNEGTHRVPHYLVFFFVARKAMPNFAVIANLKLAFAGSHGGYERLRNIFDNDLKFIVQGGKREFRGLRDGIEFRNLDFSYREHVPVLSGLNMTIPKGKMTAIVGSTGAGKSTLAQLLMRLYDCPAGTIFVDGTDIREYSLVSWLSRIAFVSQETQLFHDTLRANLVYGLEKEPSEAEILESVSRAQLDDLMRRLPEGLETRIGDRGVQLSGGERQRVAIARAFLKKADILILDEATSALDTLKEKRIKAAIDRIIVDRTAIVIAHRLSTISSADKIVVLEQGRIVEEGALDNLVARRGVFHEFWKAQEYSEELSL